MIHEYTLVSSYLVVRFHYNFIPEPPNINVPNLYFETTTCILKWTKTAVILYAACFKSNFSWKKVITNMKYNRLFSY